MLVPQIRMESQFAQIQIETTPAKQEIRQSNAELTIKQPPAEVNIKTIPGKLDIDQSQAWEDMNLMSILKRNKKFAQEGMQKVLEGTGRRAREGTELKKIENGGNPLISQAVNKGFRQQKSLGIKFIPSYGSVKIHYEPAEVQIDVKTNKPIIQSTPQKPIIQYQPGTVKTSMKQYPELEISVVNIEI